MSYKYKDIKTVNLEMSFYEEYASFFKDLGPIGTAGYKFFDSFKFDNEEKTISFHEDYEHKFEDGTLFKEFQQFVKQEKKTIRNLQKDINAKELQRKCIFFFIKLQENSIFEVNERKYILIYTDMCLDRLIEWSK
jgi:hypothetical protein